MPVSGNGLSVDIQSTGISMGSVMPMPSGRATKHEIPMTNPTEIQGGLGPGFRT